MRKELLDTRTLQRTLKTLGFYSGGIDGLEGPKTVEAQKKALVHNNVDISSWDVNRVRTGAEQLVFKVVGFDPGKIDGRIGSLTLDAQERFQNKARDTEPSLEAVSHLPSMWPRERDVRSYYGDPGENQVTLKLPYPMKLAWALETKVSKLQCHTKVSASLGRIFQATLDHYGQEAISELHLDHFGGCLNVRKKKGGNSYSMHSWGVAVDLDPSRNQLRWGRDRASLADPEYNQFWVIVESEGWVSLGRERNFDWMHFQAARF